MAIVAHDREDVDKIMHDFPCTRTLAVSKFSCMFDPMGIWQPLRSIQVLMARSFHGMTWDEAASDGEMDGGVA